MQHTANGTVRREPDILIVDDTPENLELLAAMLKEKGYKTRPVPSGKTALMAAQSKPPDLILLDINMPDMDGYEVCARLKAHPDLKDIPVIFVSACSDTLDKVKAFSLGAVDYVTKPFQNDEVMARVRTHLQLRDYSLNLEQMVAERTSELAAASDKLREMSRIKDDFLHMIAHELRTPANGILGFGYLLSDPELTTQELAEYADMYNRCADRLRNLIDDATLLPKIEGFTLPRAEKISLADIFVATQTELPQIRLDIQSTGKKTAFCVAGSMRLLKRAMQTFVRLGCAFSADKHAARITLFQEEGQVHITISLDNMTVPEKDLAEFFKLATNVRGSSHAQDLGLAPVVARRIFAAHGGELVLTKEKELTGFAEVRLPLVE